MESNNLGRQIENFDSTDSIHQVNHTAPIFYNQKYASKTSLSALPSLPAVSSSTDDTTEAPPEPPAYESYTPENSYVEFDFSSTGNRTDNTPAEKVITSGRPRLSSNGDVKLEPASTQSNTQKLINEDDFFNIKATEWKSMAAVSETDYYNERGDLEFTSSEYLKNDHKNGFKGYTKIDTEEQVAKYSLLDRKTDFLFLTSNINPKVKEKILVSDDEDSDSDSDYNVDDIDYNETLQSTRGMLDDNQKFAYVGLVKLFTVEMATDLAKIKRSTSMKIARTLSMSQKNFANWSMYVISKLYEHLNLVADEQKMIENLSIHGLEIADLTKSLTGDSIKGINKKRTELDPEHPFDLRWVLVCDLFLLLLSDGYYDARSRTLLVKFADSLGISGLEILQFERRLMESLELDTDNQNKSLDNDDEKLNDKLFIQRRIQKNKKKRLAYIGLATLGGGLAIGLSAGLLAPVIGAGLAAGLTTVGISGAGGFLAGVGGSAIITTGGVFAGAKVGSKAGARRLGEVQTFELKPLHNNKRTNLIITVSGWMNGNLDDVRLPFSTVDPVMGDMFSLLWEPEMLQSMGQTINILASEALTTSIQQILGATVLTALMSAIQLPMALTKLSYLLDNPWNVSLDRAWKAGKILADTIMSGNLGVRPITLVGFSLGARMIYSCLIDLAQRGGYGLVENVIILGCPITVHLEQVALARSVVTGEFINGYSKKDWILGYLFRATGGGILSVAGISSINVDGIENINCTEFVEGHMSYRKAIPKILKAMDWQVLSEEFAEIEEPDPEQGEKTRKLINEFDEARAKMIKESKQDQTKKTWKNWFKPKQKDWWDIYGETDKKNEEHANKESKKNSDEYESPTLFDVDALKEEVNELTVNSNTNRTHDK